MDEPSLFDDVIRDIIENNVKFCTVKAGTGLGKSTTFIGKLCKYGSKTVSKRKVLLIVPTRTAVENLYRRFTKNSIKGVDVNFSVGFAANRIVKYKNYKISYIRNILNETDELEIEDSSKDTTLVICTAGHFKNLLYDLVKYIQQEDSINSRSISVFDYVVIDEAHLRTMDIDIIIRILKYLLVSFPTKGVPNIICTSATYNEPKLYDLTTIRNPYTARIVYIDDFHGKNIREKINSIAEIVSMILEPIPDKGICLIFLPGIKEINAVIKESKKYDFYLSCDIIVAHGSKSEEEMREVFTPNKPGKWKIILSTNIAETSITINDLSVIFDSCVENIKVVGPNDTTLTRLEYISKDSAMQRAGRTGRTRDGVVVRLVSEGEYENFPESRRSELDRLPIINELLKILECNIDLRFIFGDINNGISRSISEEQIKKLEITQNKLIFLGVIEKCGDFNRVTEKGSFISRLTVGVKTGVLIYKFLGSKTPLYPIIVAGVMIENGESLFENFRPPDEFISDIPLFTFIKPWLLLTSTYGDLRISDKKLLEFCNKHELKYENMKDAHRKIMDCKSKLEILGYEVEAFVFDPEQVFLLIRKYLDMIYSPYVMIGDKNKFIKGGVKKSKGSKLLKLSDRFTKFQNDIIPTKIGSIVNVEMNGELQILIWYPYNYKPKRIMERLKEPDIGELDVEELDEFQEQDIED
jgi:superfamily II DNA/RNA helicase